MYGNIDPTEVQWMPKCLSFTWFGIRCPGCGTQRAIHSLLGGEFRTAFFYNPLLVLSIPYIIAVFILDLKFVKSRYPKLHRALLGEKAIWVLLALIMIYTVARNFFEI